jgi:hypothetical protein
MIPDRTLAEIGDGMFGRRDNAQAGLTTERPSLAPTKYRSIRIDVVSKAFHGHPSFVPVLE